MPSFFFEECFVTSSSTSPLDHIKNLSLGLDDIEIWVLARQTRVVVTCLTSLELTQSAHCWTSSTFHAHNYKIQPSPRDRSTDRQSDREIDDVIADHDN